MKLMKKTIIFLGILLCTYVFGVNIIYTATISNSWEENVTFNHLNIVNYILIFFIIIGIYFFSNYIQNKIESKLNNKKYIILVIFLIAFILISLFWIFWRKSYPIADSMRVYEAGVEMYKGNTITNLKYFELYPQNLCLSYIFSKVFVLLGSDNVIIIKLLNILANCATIVGLFKISGLLEKKYEINKILLGILIFTYIPIILLVNFTYGDLVGLPFVLFSIYSVMKYNQKGKFYYLLISAILLMISVIIRMNNLIFVIANTMYLILNLKINKNKVIAREDIITIILKVVSIILFICISVFPANFLKQMLINRYSLNEDNKFPIIGFLAMGMEEGKRANGWYNETSANIGWQNIENSKDEYKKIIKNRIKEFSENILYTMKFYVKKTASMWAEPLQESIWQNLSFNFDEKYINEKTEEEKLDYKNKDEEILKDQSSYVIYQKALIIIIFLSTTLFLIKNRNNISNELIILLLCFIGGFMFHALWEGKSRYIIPYIIILTPIVSLKTNQNSIKEKEE